MFRSLAAVAAFAAALPANAASSGDEMHKVQARVSLAGLELSDPADVAEFDKRLAHQARLICGRGVHPDLRFSAEVEACRASVTANGRAQFSRLVEASQHKGRTVAAN